MLHYTAVYDNTIIILTVYFTVTTHHNIAQCCTILSLQIHDKILNYTVYYTIKGVRP